MWGRGWHDGTVHQGTTFVGSAGFQGGFSRGLGGRKLRNLGEGDSCVVHIGQLVHRSEYGLGIGKPGGMGIPSKPYRRREFSVVASSQKVEGRGFPHGSGSPGARAPVTFTLSGVKYRKASAQAPQQRG